MREHNYKNKFWSCLLKTSKDVSESDIFVTKRKLAVIAMINATEFTFWS